jgi:hypothetical protein
MKKDAIKIGDINVDHASEVREKSRLLRFIRFFQGFLSML